MRRSLQTLGLRSLVESERGGWVDMVAGRGMVALHDSAISETGERSGETQLSFEADDIEELTERCGRPATTTRPRGRPRRTARVQ